MRDLFEVCGDHGLPEAEALKFVEDSKFVGAMEVEDVDFQTHVDVFGKRFKIMSTMKLVNVVGPPASGKSLFCHSLIAAVLNEQDMDVCYIDCDGTFSSILLNRLGCANFPSLRIVRVRNWIELVSTLELQSYCGIIFVDSITPLLRFDVQHLNLKSKIIDSVFALLRRACTLAVVVNQTTTKFVDGDEEDSILVPCLGRAYQRAVEGAEQISTF